MDFIIKRLNKMIENSESDSLEHLTLLRERVEYVLFFLLGYLWNDNFEKLNIDNKS